MQILQADGLTGAHSKALPVELVYNLCFTLAKYVKTPLNIASKNLSTEQRKNNTALDSRTVQYISLSKAFWKNMHKDKHRTFH